MSRLVLIFLIFIVQPLSVVFANVEKLNPNKRQLTYNLYFNGALAGKIIYDYVGKKNYLKSPLLYVTVDFSVAFFDLKSKEYIYLDERSKLPLKISRKIHFLGRKEVIREIYNQQQGYVKIFNSNGKRKTLYSKTPIHNALALLYFFPLIIDNSELKKGTVLNFNLPTNQLNLKVEDYRNFNINGERLEGYVLKGTGPAKFEVFFDKKEQLIIRVEINSAFGKLVVSRI